MSLEIERKFLVRPKSWTPDETRGVRYRQGYLSTDPARVVRVRTAGSSAFITIKGPNTGIVRSEFEYAIPLADAEAMLDHLCAKPLIEKTRYRETIGGRLWEIDVFSGDNAGLMVAEVELPAADAPVVLPDWAGAEVSNDPRYFNSNLVQHPFSSWNADGDHARA
jgi:adenylate cyclase